MSFDGLAERLRIDEETRHDEDVEADRTLTENEAKEET
jgi:hypothetical protein